MREQDYPHVEHLIVDGASKDATLNLLHLWEKQSEESETPHKLVVVSEPDKGLYDAMNKALRLASGDYVLFLNAGDCFHTSTTLSDIARSVAEANYPPQQLPAVLYGDTDLVDNEGQFLRHRRLSPPEKLTWRSFQQGMLVCHQAFLRACRFLDVKSTMICPITFRPTTIGASASCNAQKPSPSPSTTHTSSWPTIWQKG